MNAYDITELRRRIANIVRFGTVKTLVGNAVTVAIETDEGDQIITDPRPFLASRAGADAEWHAPEPGEQVVLLSIGGDLSQAIVLPALYSDAFPAPANSADISCKKFKDGTTIEYNRASHTLDINVQGSSAVNVKAVNATVDAEKTHMTGDVVIDKSLTVLGASALNGGVTAQGGSGVAMKITGSVEATEDVKAGSISLVGHAHGGVQSGGSDTSGPK